MRIAGLKLNDCIDGEGISVSLWTQGCPHRCPGCHNPETWNFEGGYEDYDLKSKIIKGLTANGINRNFSILGGEPLCEQNKNDVLDILLSIKTAYPNTKIFLWTGYTYEYLLELNDNAINTILVNVDMLIDGLYDRTERDLSLYLRGSRNQRIIDLKQMRDKNTKNLILVDKPKKI